MPYYLILVSSFYFFPVSLSPYVLFSHHIYIQATHAWIKAQVEADVAAGSNVAGLASSEVVVQVTDTLDQLKH